MDQRVGRLAEHAERFIVVIPVSAAESSHYGARQNLSVGYFTASQAPPPVTTTLISKSDIDFRYQSFLSEVLMRELTRAAVRLHILHHAAEEDIHGAWMSAELSNHGDSISPGTLYPTLHRVQKQGLLTSRQEVIGGRPHRIYRATPQGLEALAEGRRAVAGLAGAVLPQPTKANDDE